MIPVGELKEVFICENLKYYTEGLSVDYITQRVMGKLSSMQYGVYTQDGNLLTMVESYINAKIILKALESTYHAPLEVAPLPYYRCINGKKNKVVVGVRGGVAYEDEVVGDVEVEINDYDNFEDE